jgi:Na+/H+ antiporter NhaD/arsenite permease-like protein
MTFSSGSFHIVHLFMGSLSGTAPEIQAWMMIPFGLLLLMIASMPFIHKHWWEENYSKVALFFAVLAISYYGFAREDWTTVLHTGHEYVSFMAMVVGLFVISGGIHIGTKGGATPLLNTSFLAAACVISNIIGTTGASMLLIRPWIRMNKYRITEYHIVFFIFIVSNVSGCLTPIGDPPLFLGYLKGIPFFWTLEKFWSAWMVAVGLLLSIFYFVDRYYFLRAPERVRNEETDNEVWSIRGKRNLIPLSLLLGAVFIKAPIFLREILMFSAAAYSFWTTPKPIHQANHFNFAPVKEVAWLFLGIFATMMPALGYLQSHAASLGLDSPLKFYWITGLLSGALDNAPTYLTFLSACLGLHGKSIENPSDVLWLIQEKSLWVEAISLGAVFFGAMTYIGNGPNLMVKTIAEQSKVQVPSFFGYIVKYALPVLIPVIAIVGWIFLRQ